MVQGRAALHRCSFGHPTDCDTCSQQSKSHNNCRGLSVQGSPERPRVLGLLRSDLRPQEPLPLPRPQGLRRANHNLSFGASRQAAAANCQLESCTSAPGDLFYPWHTRVPPILAFRKPTWYKFALFYCSSPWIFARADAAAPVRMEAKSLL